MKYSRDIPVLLQDKWLDIVFDLRQRDEGKALEIICFALGVAFGEFMDCDLTDPELQAIWAHTKITTVKGRRCGRVVFTKKRQSHGA